MTNVPRDRKKSDFLEESVIPSTATFDFVSNGTNYKIPIADMITAFGTTGTLEQLGDPGQTTILDVDGTVNRIRNLEDGPGVKACVSVAGGAELSHNFSRGDSGQPVFINMTSASPVIRNLVAGDGISIASSGNNLLVSQETFTPAASNLVIVNEISDFPAPVGSVITLGDDSAYLVSAALSSSNRYVLGSNTLLYGADSSVASLEYTGTGAMFTGVDVSSKITLLSISAPNGILVDISATTPGYVFQFINATITACDSCGTITDMSAIQITDVAFNSIVTGGFLFVGSLGLFVGTRNIFDITAGTLFDFGTATFSSGFTLESSFITLAAGATFMDGLVDSGNIDADSLGVVFNTRISGAGTILNNINGKDARWSFQLNDDIPNSINSILTIQSGALISILAIDTPVKVGATWTADYESRFTNNTNGTFTYIGKGAHVNINIAITAALSGGPTERDCTFYIYKNGVQITASGTTRSLSITGPASISMVWQEDVETNDYFEMFVENNENTDDVDIDKIVLGISG